MYKLAFVCFTACVVAINLASAEQSKCSPATMKRVYEAAITESYAKIEQFEQLVTDALEHTTDANGRMNLLNIDSTVKECHKTFWETLNSLVEDKLSRVYPAGPLSLGGRPEKDYLKVKATEAQAVAAACQRSAHELISSGSIDKQIVESAVEVLATQRDILVNGTDEKMAC